MMQIANHALQNPKDTTRLFLVAANSRVADMIMEDELISLHVTLTPALTIRPHWVA